MEVHANLENVLKKVNNFINIDANRQKYAEHFDNLKNTIFKELRKNDVFNYLLNGFQLGGSYGDNVKVSIPNEYDLVFNIKFPEPNLIEVKKDHELPGNVHLDFTKVIQKIAKEKQHENNLLHIKQWLDNENYLKVEKFQMFLRSCFISVLTKMEYQITFNGKTSSLRYSREGPAHTVKVTESLDFIYSVDFVPGILLNAAQSVIPNIVGQWEAIPKPTPINNPSYKSFRASFYRQEQNLIKGRLQLKNVYRMMKKFRDSKSNMMKMKSYYIKTLFLWKSSRENVNYWSKSLTEIIIDMFKDMEKSLREENLPFYWDTELNLYDRYQPRLLREMLGCVESSREILEKAAKELTPALQKKVYRIFLVEKERNLLEAQNNGRSLSNAESNGNPNKPKLNQNQNNHGADKKDASKLQSQQNESSKSSCLIS
ncbi:cyclic GMP-AMP synthase-like receptor [Calliphora vicina]|uniref:cyclic GMP-AMP synthase-like receptor n=1 Tax=Calliphora vicina TaxID=7373 RepID=UPI00325BE1D4